MLAVGFGGDLTSSLSGVGGVAWRLGCIILIIFAWVMHADIAKGREFTALFLPWLICCIIEAAIRTMSSGGTDYVADVFRQIFIVATGASVYAIAHVRAQRSRLRLVMFAASCLTTILSAIVAYSLVKNGWSYEAIRATKNVVIEKTGFGANLACFAGLIAALAAYDPARRSKTIVMGLIIFLVLLSVLLTARAPVALLVVGALVAWGATRMAWLRRKSFKAGFIGSSIVLALIVGSFFTSIDWIAHSDIAKELAGRAALWQIGLSGWKGNQLLGTGLRTFHDVIATNLGAGTYTTAYERNSLYALESGAFHNIWVTTLGERGAIGLLGLYLTFSLLFARMIGNLKALTKHERFFAILTLSFLFLRGFVEIAGLMSYSDGAVDAIVVVAIALLIAPSGDGQSGGRRSVSRGATKSRS